MNPVIAVLIIISVISEMSILLLINDNKSDEEQKNIKLIKVCSTVYIGAIFIVLIAAINSLYVYVTGTAG